MAGVSLKAIKARIKSVESTMQITRAMELVAASKLKKAKQQALITKPVYDILMETITDIQEDKSTENSVFFKEKEDPKICYIIISGDRGLAGGYNSNLFKAVREHSKGKEFCVLPIGKKSHEFYGGHGYEIVNESYITAADVDVANCYEIGKMICDGFLTGEFDKVYVAYTKFLSVLSQEPVIDPVLPIVPLHDREVSPSAELTIYEPSAEGLLEQVVIQYISELVYCAVSEAAAAEHAARRNSMSAANKNGSEMLDNMRLQYNRARQAVITQELTEIVAGAEAL